MLGLPDKDYGEVVCAIVVPEVEVKRRRDEELKPALTLHELSDWAKEKLAPYKVSPLLVELILTVELMNHVFPPVIELGKRIPCPRTLLF